MMKFSSIKNFSFCLATLIAALSFSGDASAEFVTRSDKRPPSPERLVFPDTRDGYHVFPGELHIHTVFSDGAAWPSLRLVEAMQDGLKFVSFTEHDVFTPKIRDTGADKNRSYEIARSFIDNRMFNLQDMKVSLGSEITRNIGHFNCHFLKDANALNPRHVQNSKMGEFSRYLTVDWNDTSAVEKDVEAKLREAKKQGAICQWNHPTYPSPVPAEAVVTPFLKRMFEEGLLSGIEVAGSDYFHPSAMDVAQKYNLYVAATTDAHMGTKIEQAAAGMEHRVTTLFLTNGDDENAFKDALEKRRTVGLFRSTFLGSKDNVQKIVESVLQLKLTSYVPSELLMGTTASMDISNSAPVDMELEITDPDLKVVNYPKFVKIPAGSKITLKIFKFDGAKFSGIKVRVINTLVTSHDQLEFVLKAEPFDLKAITKPGDLHLPEEFDGFM